MRLQKGEEWRKRTGIEPAGCVLRRIPSDLKSEARTSVTIASKQSLSNAFRRRILIAARIRVKKLRSSALERCTLGDGDRIHTRRRRPNLQSL